MSSGVVIVGGGQAAAQAAASLRQEGFDRPIALISAEGVLPYQRPPLSKGYLSGQIAAERLFVRPPSFYEQSKIEVRLGTPVSKLHVEEKQVELDTGERIAFEHLVLATGGRPRKLTCPGADHPRLFSLRQIYDVLAMQPHLQPGAHIVLVGGGYIGLEIAAIARKLGLTVTVLEAAQTLLARVTCPEVASFYQGEHEAQGVKVRCGVLVTGIEGDEAHPTVVTASGERIDADIVVAGIGLLPNVELAAEAGLACDNGIIVDEECHTSAPGVYAVGDCTRHPSAIYGTHLRLESVPNAIEQGRTVAATICGKFRPYRSVPWFWSDQYDIKLQTAGLNRGYDEVIVRGRPESRSFAAYYLERGRLLAVDAINRPAEFSLAKTWIAEDVRVPAAKLADDRIAPKDLAAAGPVAP